MRKILIIKLGYSETLDRMLGLTTSLGDVLRTTFILHYFKGCDVSWLVDEKAVPLLEGNEYIKRILFYNDRTLSELGHEEFDDVINFEKMPEICYFSDSLKAKRRFGFRVDGGDKGLIEISRNIEKKRSNTRYWQEILAEAIGEKWNEERYLLGYKPRSQIRYDIGFNWATSSKWNNKMWPRDYWEELGRLFKSRYSISWQQGMEDIYNYIDWINSCRVIVTSDSLGFHLSLALDKKVVCMFGPTSHREMCFYGNGAYLLPESPYDCLPCLKPLCDKERQCMEYISPDRVKERVENELKEYTSARAL